MIPTRSIEPTDMCIKIDNMRGGGNRRSEGRSKIVSFALAVVTSNARDRTISLQVAWEK